MTDRAVGEQAPAAVRRMYRLRTPSPRSRKYTTFRADQMLMENHALDLPINGGFIRSMVELEAEAERQSLIFARRARFYSSLYYLFGLPAAILAAIAGATALASTTGRVAAGMTPSLQRAGRLRHALADLAVRAIQDRIMRQLVGACCGQHCGQRPARRSTISAAVAP
jgi:hypothetical protein